MRSTIAGCLLAMVAGSAMAAKAPPYTYARVGNASDVATAVTSGVVMMGGSTDVDAAFQWQCGLSGNGDFLVIRATGTDAYNPYIRALCPASNSVATLIIPSTTAANHATVLQLVQKAEAIWIAGGDQSNYVKSIVAYREFPHPSGRRRRPDLARRAATGPHG